MAKTSSSGDIIKGGLSDKLTLQDIAKKNGVPLSEIEAQHKKGIKVEMEHTNNPKIAYEIAKDHLAENYKYYDYLSAMEKKMDKDVKVTANGKAGGLLAGKAHSECDENGCGIKAIVTDHGGIRPVELEAEEAIINKRTMKDPSIYSVTGTPAQIASAINELNGNGVKFASGAKVETVKKVKKFGYGGVFSSTPESLSVLLDDLFKDHCGAFTFAQGIARTTDSNLASSKELLLAQWNNEIKEHFAEEENELFPLINDGTNDLLIDQLLKEHMYFESVIASIELGETVDSSTIREFAKKLMLHIQTEDALFMKYGENKYSSPLALVQSGADAGTCVYCVKGTPEQIRNAIDRYQSANGDVKIEKVELVQDKKLFGGVLDPKDKNYLLAVRMQKDKVSPIEIWAKTGWYYNTWDNKWRTEIDDSHIRLLISYDQIFSNLHNGKYIYTYKDLIDFPELFEKYPEVKDIQIEIDNEVDPKISDNANSGFKNDKFHIYLHINFNSHAQRHSDIKGNSQKSQRIIRPINHETQHFLQYKHDFAGASGYLEEKGRIRREIESLRARALKIKGNPIGKKALIDKANQLESNINNFSYASYVSYLGEIETRDVDSRINYSKDKRKSTLPYSSNIIPSKEIINIPASKFRNRDSNGIKFESGGIPSANDYHGKAKSILESLSAEDLEALKNTYKEAVDAVLLKEQVKLDELAVERERLLSQKKLLESSGAYNSTGAIIAQIGAVDVRARGVNNTILAIRNNGDTVSFTDKKGDSHSGIPDFSKVDTRFISFDVDTILTDALPAYIPLIDEKVFAGKGYIFDTIRIAKDYYILAVNGFNEFNVSYRLADSGQKTKREDWEQGYVMVTLDQLALISDYYYTKAKATERKKAEESNLEMEKRYSALPVARREAHFAQANYYRSLPVAVKKKVTEAEWNGFTLEQKESFYKPIAYKQGKRLVSKLDDKTMWTSFHDMYERFLNPLAVKPRAGIGNPEVFTYWRAFRYQMDWKVKDIGVQRQFESDIRAAAIETSFGESNTDAELREKYGILVKRQSGDKIKPNEIDQIRKAWVNVCSVFGDLSTIAKDANLKISHTGTKLVFASKAAGMYVPSMGAIAVSNKFGDNQFESILAHEVGHLIDNKLGGESGHRYYSDDFESTAGLVADALRRNMNVPSASDYINSTKECFARAMELYFSISTFGDNASVIYSYTELDRKRPYFFEDHYVSKEVYYTVLKPLIEAFLSENKTFLNYNVDVKGNAPIKDFSEKPIEINTNLASAKTNDKMDKIKFSEEALNFVPLHQLDSIMGSEQYNDSIEKINEIVDQMPTINDATDETTEAKIWLHYFSDDLAGNKENWYINRKDAGDGDEHIQFNAIGYYIDANGEIKYRDININELLENDKVELDLYFEPMQWSELYASKYPEEAELESDEKIAEELMGIYSDVVDKFKIESGSQLYADIELQKQVKSELDSAIKDKFVFPLSQGVFDELEDANYHALNSYLTYSGAFGEEAKDYQAKWYYGLEKEYRQNHLNPAVFGIEGEVKEVAPAVKSAEEILGTVAGLEDVIKKYKDSKKEKYLVDEALGSYVRIVYENPLFYTRFTDFVSDTLRSSQYYIQYSDEANEVVRDADTFHNNIVAGGLNIWNLIPEKFKVSPKVRPVAFKTTPDDKGLIEIHSNFVLDDKEGIRGRLFQTHFDSTGVVSTDAQVLLFTKKRDNYTAGDYCLTKRCFELKEADFEGRQYPNYKSVVPKVDDHMSFIRINHESVLLYLNTLKKLKLMAPKDKIVFNVNGVLFGFNLNLFKNAVEGMIKMGHNDITMAYSNPTRAIVLFPTVDKDKVEKYKTDFVLVMPVMLSNAEGGELYVDEKLPVYDLFSNCITNQGVDVCLTNYEAEAKYKALEKETQELKKKAIVARPTKKKYNRVDTIEEIEALEIALMVADPKEMKTISKAIDMLKERLEDMGETKECGGYVLEQDGIIIEEFYPEN